MENGRGKESVSITISKISRRFGDFQALDEVSLNIRDGEMVALLGPSGSGKTTLLRIIAGLDFPDRGDIRFGDESVVDLGAKERGVGFVFQHYALFRHMKVFENIAFGLRVRPRATRPSEAEIGNRVRALLELVQLGWIADRFPNELSGGQRQRVALARALAIEPSVLLLDEPFGALDAKVRKELRRWLKRLNSDMKMTSVFVTHDQEEAMEVADRVVVMNQGRIEQIGTPAEIYGTPASPFVHEFLGDVNKIPCAISQGKAAHGGVDLAALGSLNGDGRGLAYVRPQDFSIEVTPKGNATVTGIHIVGHVLRVEAEAAGSHVEVELTGREAAGLTLAPGARILLTAVRGQIYPQH